MSRIPFRRWFSRPTPQPLRRPRDWVEAPAAPLAEEAPPKGSGWYDSSLDLRRGLVVREVAVRPLQIVIA